MCPTFHGSPSRRLTSQFLEKWPGLRQLVHALFSRACFFCAGVASMEGFSPYLNESLGSAAAGPREAPLSLRPPWLSLAPLSDHVTLFVSFWEGFCFPRLITSDSWSMLRRSMASSVSVRISTAAVQSIPPPVEGRRFRISFISDIISSRLANALSRLVPISMTSGAR